MSPTHAYHLFLAHFLRAFSVACIMVWGLMSTLIVVDWIGAKGWGYNPWFALPFALFGVAVGFGLYKVSSAWLRRLRT